MAETLSKSKPSRTQGRSAVDIIDEEVARGKRVLTPLGKKLLEARRAIEASDIPLLTDEELEQEKIERRLGVEIPFRR
jgi:hypothetical protein